MSDFIEARDVSYSYEPEASPLRLALERVSFVLPKGSHAAVLGRNGSGKSTLARLLNALELPLGGSVVVASMRTDDDAELWTIRSLCGMVFQNPDNQIVATTVEEDVAFGPENQGVAPAEIRARVDEALAYVGLEAMAQKMPSELSGGQKQKLAIAGILAMRPEILILDEATSMLDPQSRRSFMELVLKLKEERDVTVINITHDMKEVLMADSVLVLSQGKVLIMGTPPEIFHDVERIRGLGLDAPVHSAIAYDIARALGTEYKLGAAATRHGAEAVIRELLAAATPAAISEAARKAALKCEQKNVPVTQAEHGLAGDAAAANLVVVSAAETAESAIVLRVSHLNYDYEQGRPAAAGRKPALTDINFELRRGEILGLMGHSGSGKSTLVQHLNGLLRIQSGSVRVLDFDLSSVKDIRAVRRHVGLLFQYPEHQLFAASVREDIAFGPKKMGLDDTEAERRVLEALTLVRLSDELLERSPFELSGGQKRRVAIAGILAMQPEILILDEPAAGLDPSGRDEILSYVKRLQAQGTTVILVSHSMEDLARMADRILVLCEGRQVMLDTPEAIFAQKERLQSYQLSVPGSQLFLERFKGDYPELNTAQYTVEKAAANLLAAAAARTAPTLVLGGDEPG